MRLLTTWGGAKQMRSNAAERAAQTVFAAARRRYVKVAMVAIRSAAPDLRRRSPPIHPAQPIIAEVTLRPCSTLGGYRVSPECRDVPHGCRDAHPHDSVSFATEAP